MYIYPHKHYACVYMCVKCGMHIPWCVCGGQKIISGVCPHLLPCLR